MIELDESMLYTMCLNAGAVAYSRRRAAKARGDEDSYEYWTHQLIRYAKVYHYLSKGSVNEDLVEFYSESGETAMVLERSIKSVAANK